MRLFNFFILVSGFFLFQQNTHASLPNEIIPFSIAQDSVVLIKQRNDKQMVIHAGSKLKLWLKNKEVLKGELISMEQDTLQVISDGTRVMIPVSNIKKMKVRAGKAGKIVGVTLMAVGAAAMFYGGLSLAVAIASFITDDIGAILIFAVPVLFGGGYGVYKAGDAIHSRKFDLTSKWVIAPGEN